MGYGVRDLACIKNQICIACKDADAGKYRRCHPCRAKLAAKQAGKVKRGTCRTCGRWIFGRAKRCKSCKAGARPYQMSYTEWKKIKDQKGKQDEAKRQSL